MQEVEASQSGPRSLVLLHGMGTGPGAWLPQIDALGQEFDVKAPALPGYGPEPGPFTFQGAVESIAPLLATGGHARTSVCGLSLGALVALELARSHPTAIDRLVLSAGFVSIPEEHQAAAQVSAQAIKGLDAQAFTEQVLNGLVRDVPEPYREQALEEIGGLTPGDVANILVLDFDARGWIGDLTMPALVLCGEEDEVNLPLSRELADRLPNAIFEVLPGAGHVANLDAPAAFTNAVRRFLTHE